MLCAAMPSELSPTDPAHSACVHASAGTGKTWQLVTRIIRLLLSGTQPASILAVTFTRKAAAEMMERLVARLKALAGADDGRLPGLLAEMGVKPGDALFARARSLYEAFLLNPRPLRATTFHAFCQEVLQRFPLEANVPPGFELLEADAGVRQAAWDALFAETTHTPQSRLAVDVDTLFALCGSLDSTRKALKSFLDHRIDWWALCQDRQEPASWAAEQLQQDLGIDPAGDPIADFFSDRRCGLLREFADLIGRHQTSTNSKRKADIERGLLTNPASTERFADIQRAFLTQANTPRKSDANKAVRKSLGDQNAERMARLHIELSQDVLDCCDSLARLATWRRTTAWYRVGQRLLEHFQRLKREQRLLDFNDLEWHAYRLLNSGDNAQWVQYKLDARIDHLLIDEFQDTNPTQWRLLLPLLKELAAGNDTRRRSVFLVGDAKQSIYRFRRADARLLDAASEWLEQSLHAAQHTLESSWRSSPAIIQFVNRVFGTGVLHEQLGDFRPHSTHLDDLWGKVEMLPVIRATASDDDGADSDIGLRDPLRMPRRIAEDLRHYQEGLEIAQRIRDRVDGRVPVGETGAARPMRYSDVLILMRSRTHLPAYEQALRDRGIPYIGGGRGTLLESLEVRDLEALLNVLIAPYHNLALAQVLRSPLFHVSDEDLLSLAQPDQGLWIERLQRLAVTLPAAHSLSVAASCLTRWQKQVGRLPVHDLLDRIYHEGDVINRFARAFPPPLRARVRANLTRFLELALEVDSGRYPSLPHFINRLQELRAYAADAPDDAPPDSAGSERVRIMTVHGAKGLEAPFVVLVDSATSGRSDRAWEALVEWPASQDRPSCFLLAGRKDELDTFSATRIQTEEAADACEEANLLYVALTRARQFLTISAAAPGRDSDLGWYALIASQIEAAEPLENGQAWQLEHGEPPLLADVIDQQAAAPAIDARLSRPLSVYMSEREIAPSRQAEPFLATVATDIDSRRRGTAIHRFLELLSGVPAFDEGQALRKVAREHQREAEDPELMGYLAEARQTLTEKRFHQWFDADGYDRAYNEVPVAYSAQGALVYGIIDRVVIRGERVDIIDYKTHEIAADSLSEVGDQYAAQMRLYARGAAQLWPEREVHAWLLFTACGQSIEIPVSEETAAAPSGNGLDPGTTPAL